MSGERSVGKRRALAVRSFRSRLSFQVRLPRITQIDPAKRTISRQVSPRLEGGYHKCAGAAHSGSRTFGGGVNENGVLSHGGKGVEKNGVLSHERGLLRVEDLLPGREGSRQLDGDGREGPVDGHGSGGLRAFAGQGQFQHVRGFPVKP